MFDHTSVVNSTSVSVNTTTLDTTTLDTSGTLDISETEVVSERKAFESVVDRCGDVVVESVDVSLGGVKILHDISISHGSGRTLAVLGPSGCGKTTLLRTLAGLYRVDTGTVALKGSIVSAEGVHVPANKRGVGMVFQDCALFPHLSVIANVAFGLPRAERPRSWFRPKPASSRVYDLLDMLEITDLAHRFPGSLSGGQCQRVALARALAPQPSVLLLDEPFASLDAALRLEVRSDVAVLLRELGITCVLVTHDQGEAFVLGDEVAVMRSGTVVQQAPPDVIYEHPVNLWVAEFVGEVNIVAGVASNGVADTPLGRIPLLRFGSDDASVSGKSSVSGNVNVLLRPEQLYLVEGSDAIVDRFEYYGHDTLYYLRTRQGTMLQCRANGAPRFIVGASVDVRHSGVSTVAFPKL